MKNIKTAKLAAMSCMLLITMSSAYGRAQENQPIEKVRAKRHAEIQQAQQAAEAERRPPANEYVNTIRVAGIFGRKALIVFPDQGQHALLLGIGDAHGNIKVTAIGSDSVTAEIAGQQCHLSIAGEYAVIVERSSLPEFVRLVADRIDRVKPYVTGEALIEIDNQGHLHLLSGSDDVIVDKAAPYMRAPEWLKSIRVHVSFSPKQRTQAELVSVDFLDK